MNMSTLFHERIAVDWMQWNSDSCLFISYDLVLRYVFICFFFFFQAEDGIRDRSVSRGLGDGIRDKTTGVSNPV